MKRISLVLLGFFCLLLTGCGGETKEVKTLKDFETSGTNNGFTVTDNLLSYNNAKYITGSYVAALDDTQVEMVVYDTEANAKKAQDNQIKSFKNIKSSGATGSSEKGENYYSFTLISNGYYMVTSRIDNTLIFSKTLIENKDKVTTLLDSLDY